MSVTSKREETTVGKLDEYLERAEGTIFNASDAPEKLPAGIYDMRIQDARVDLFGDKQLPKIMWECYVASGEYQGEMIPAFTGLVADAEKPPRGQQFMLSRGRLMWTKFCEFAGVAFPADMRDVEECVAAIRQAAPAFRARVTINRGGYNNIEVLEGLSNGVPAAPPKESRQAETSAPAEPEPQGDDEWKKGDRVVVTDDGKEYHGVIDAINGEVADLGIDGDENIWEVKLDELEPEEAEQPQDGAREKLIDLAGTLGIDHKEDDDEATLTKAFDAARIKRETLEPEEVKFLESLGVKLAVAAVHKKKKKGKKKRRS